jgi:hypothetical protein
VCVEEILSELASVLVTVGIRTVQEARLKTHRNGGEYPLEIAGFLRSEANADHIR